VRVPTLILYRPSERAEVEFVSERIRGSELVEPPGLEDIYTWVHDDAHERTMRATERFVAGLGRAVEPERVLATVLFTDIVAWHARAEGRSGRVEAVRRFRFVRR
jgi:hypothetical protein